MYTCQAYTFGNVEALGHQGSVRSDTCGHARIYRRLERITPSGCRPA